MAYDPIQREREVLSEMRREFDRMWDSGELSWENDMPVVSRRLKKGER